jgi:head-tail adaptor
MAGIGLLKLVKLYQYTNSKSVSGDNVETLALRYRTFAEVTGLGSSRGENRDKTDIGDSKQFKIRWRADWVLNGDWKIKYFGKIYTITGIERINEKRFNWLINASS